MYELRFAWQFLGPVKRTCQLLTSLCCLSIIFNDLQIYTFFEILSWNDCSEYSTEVGKTKDCFRNYSSCYKPSESVSQTSPLKQQGKSWVLGDMGRLSSKACMESPVSHPPLDDYLIIKKKKKLQSWTLKFYYTPTNIYWHIFSFRGIWRYRVGKQ